MLFLVSNSYAFAPMVLILHIVLNRLQANDVLILEAPKLGLQDLVFSLFGLQLRKTVVPHVPSTEFSPSPSHFISFLQ